MMVHILFVASMLGQVRDSKPAELVPLLVSSDRAERHEAAESLLKLPSVPESALPNIVQYLKLEVSQAMIPNARPVRGDATILEKLPIEGDEISVARIKANPAQYFERPFILAGAVGISDYYNYGYDRAQDSYYSFRLAVAAKDGQLSENVPLYMPRFKGAALAERITRTHEQRSNVGMAVRLRCVIHQERTEGNIAHAAESIEVTDWQVLAKGHQSWMPWTFQSIGLGYALMFKAGKASTAACLDLIMGEQEFQDLRSDTMLKGTAITYLLGLPAKDRALAFRRVSLRAKKAKGAIAKEWTRRLYASLEAGRLIL